MLEGVKYIKRIFLVCEIECMFGLCLEIGKFVMNDSKAYSLTVNSFYQFNKSFCPLGLG